MGTDRGGKEVATDEAAKDEAAKDEERTGGGTPGGARQGPQSSRSVRYSQEITSPEEEPERPGRSLVTTDHEVIRRWARARGGRPATVEGSEHEGRPGVLRLVFADPGEDLREIGWDAWFETFDARGLDFLYQEERKDGRQSTFFHLENPGREDA